MSDDVKTCVTCKHFKRETFMFIIPMELRFAKCIAPGNGIDHVSGEPHRAYAEISRRYAGRCGHEGRLWEAK